MSTATVSEVVEAFSSAFKSVDLRIVAVRPEDQWINVITSMFLSSKSEGEVKSVQQQAKDKLPSTNKFRILLACYPFKSLPRLFTQFEKGEIQAYRIPIKFREIDLSALKVDQFTFHGRAPDYLRQNEEWSLVGSRADAAKDDAIWRIVDSQNGHARLQGYKDIYDLIKEMLRIRDFKRGTPRALSIGIPIPARIAGVSFVGSSIKIKTKKVFGLTDLQFNLSIERWYPRPNRYECVWRTTGLVEKCKRPSTREFCHVTNSIKLSDLKSHDTVEVELIHRLIPTLSLDDTRLTAPLQKPSEPFAKTLFSFCSSDVFRNRLLNPEQMKKPDKVFEDAVAWLLSLIGFSVAQLGRFEILSVPDTRYQIGSIDMIAHRENECILLVDCDTSIPDEKKIRSMMSVEDHFGFIQDEHRRPDIVSVIFSPADCTGISTDDQAIKIVDRQRIIRIFEEAMKGNLEKARSAAYGW